MTGNSLVSKILMRLLSPQKNEKPSYETPIVRITGEAYKKLNLYSKIVSEIAGNDIECCGITLNYRGRNDGVIRDAYLNYQTAKDDEVVDIYGSQEYVDYVQRLGMSQSGMWHSHGNYIPCHSRRDDKCLGLLHKSNKTQKECIITDNQRYNPSKKTSESNEAFYTSSIVVNKDEYLKDKPCKSYYAEFLVGNGKDRDVKVKNAKLEIIKENNNILPTLEEMVLEVGEKVKYKKFMRRIKLKKLPQYNSVLEKYKQLQVNHVQGYQKACVEQYSLNPCRRKILSKDVLNYITIREVKNEA